MRCLRGREADEARCHSCCCAALCLGFSVVQYIIQTTSVKTDSTPVFNIKRNPDKYPTDSPTTLVKYHE